MTQRLSPKLSALLERFYQRDRNALARLITLVENREVSVAALMDSIYSRAGRAHVIGFTGPPGAGKSTLVSRLITRYRNLGSEVAVLAIDPSSPFSGGAVLGDRIRMADHFTDHGVYIRSLSTRGSHGGLSRAARETMLVLDAFGYDPILVETAGVGQTELAIMDLAHTTVVVTVPESGDSIQVLKAGLNEIADIFVVNKGDRPGAQRLKTELELSVKLKGSQGWRVPVLVAEAVNDKGIDEVLRAITDHRAYLATNSDSEVDKEKRLREFREILTTELSEKASRALKSEALAHVVADVKEGKVNPYEATQSILSDLAVLARMFVVPLEKTARGQW